MAAWCRLPCAFDLCWQQENLQLTSQESWRRLSSGAPRSLPLWAACGLAGLLIGQKNGPAHCGPIEKAKARKDAQQRLLDEMLTRKRPAEPIGAPPGRSSPIGAPPAKAAPYEYQRTNAPADKSMSRLLPTAKPAAAPKVPSSGSGKTKGKPLTMFSNDGERRRRPREAVSDPGRGAKMAKFNEFRHLQQQDEEVECKPGVLKHDEQLACKVLSWVTRVMQAGLRDTSKLPVLLSEASQFRPTATITHCTGAGIALNSEWIWESLSPGQSRKRTALVRVWRLAVSKEISDMKRAHGKALLPAGLRRSQLMEKEWVERLKEFARHFESMQDEDRHMTLHCSRLATRLLLAGFRLISDLAGLPAAGVEKITNVPREQTLLTKVVYEMNELAAQSRVERMRRSMGLQEPAHMGPRSAMQIAATLTPEQLHALEKSNEELQQLLQVKLDAGPRAAMGALIRAKERGQTAEMQEMLVNKEHELRLSSQRKSLPQVAAGLKAWHVFATQILGYSDEATLPPESSNDVSKFLVMFSNAGTAANYLSYIRWSCKEFKKSLQWSDSSLSSLIRSIRKQDLATRVANLPEGVRFDELEIERLIILAWELHDPEWGLMACMSYQCLFRVQSEALPLEFGTADEALHPLPENRHSSVWIEGNRVYVRLRCRKNRPAGSLLVRECNCLQGKAKDQRLCPVHCMDWSNQEAGQKVFQISATAAKQKLQRYAMMLGLKGAGMATLKTFRASRATNLALQGRPIHAILEAGEWRSAAMLKYVTPEALDRGAMLTTAILEEDADD